MPSTAGKVVRSVADIVQILTSCSAEDANAKELEICKSTKALNTFALACGISVHSIGTGGKLVVAGIATGGTLSVGGAILTGAGLFAAKRYCLDMVETGAGKVEGAANNL